MRYSGWTVVPLLTGLMLACSDSTGVTDTDLVGTWKASEFTFSDFGDPVMDFHVIEPGGSATMVIGADKTYMLIVTMPVSLPDTTTGTWALPTSSRLVLTEAGTTNGVELQASLSGSTLTIHTEDVTFDFGAGEIPAQLDATFVRQ
jgi:hypothetical protein